VSDASGDDKAAEKKDAKKDKKAPPPEKDVVTEHAITIGGRTLRYRATASLLHLKDADDEPRAAVFVTSYVLLDAPEGTRRPVTFAFNGGPGSSSVWLHLGWMGPYRAAFPDPMHPPPAPYTLEVNDATVLGVTDLVFVDPVGTGYSRAVGEGKIDDYTSVKTDVESVAELVRLWITRNERWNSPKLLVGESYGGTRVAALAAHLQDKGAMLNGVCLVSAALDFSALEFQWGNDFPHAIYLPSYVAVAAYHGVTKPGDPDAAIASARRVAVNEYAPALFAGSALEASAIDAMAARLAELTGLSKTWIVQQGLRIDIARFTKELLRDRGQVVGRLDARFVGHDVDAGSGEMQADPSFSAPYGPYRALMSDYLRRSLGVTDDREYEILSFKVNEAWKWEVPKGRSGGYVNVVGELRRAMLDNPHLRVMFANGLYDLATPFYANEHAARHLGHEAHVLRNVREHLYPAGHMMYLHPPSRAQLTRDFEAFVKDAVPTPA
jgi:carboxypeptidase C (cathepsin A)